MFTKMRLFHFTVLFLALGACLVGCSPQAVDDGPLKVWVSILPQKAFVEAVAGGHAEVAVMVRPGQSPETYSPSVPQMARLAQADVYFGIGMPLERAILDRLERSMPRLTFVQTAEIPKHADEHEHLIGPKGEFVCDHGDADPHVWMDPIWVIGHVDEIEAALSEHRPDLAEQFAINAESFKRELRSLDISLREQLEPYAGRAFYINHPSLGHFAQRYGLVQRSIEQGGGAPSARQVASLVESAKSDGVGTVFSQPEFGRSSAEVLARALKVEVVELDVLSARYFRNMERIGKRLKASFAE